MLSPPICPCLLGSERQWECLLPGAPSPASAIHISKNQLLHFQGDSESICILCFAFQIRKLDSKIKCQLTLPLLVFLLCNILSHRKISKAGKLLMQPVNCGLYASHLSGFHRQFPPSRSGIHVLEMMGDRR